jgi:hypothetical protein
MGRFNCSTRLRGVNFTHHGQMTIRQRNLDRSAHVGAQRADPPVAQCGQHRRVRVPEEIVTPARDHRQARSHRVQEWIGR